MMEFVNEFRMTSHIIYYGKNVPNHQPEIFQHPNGHRRLTRRTSQEVPPEVKATSCHGRKAWDAANGGDADPEENKASII